MRRVLVVAGVLALATVAAMLGLAYLVASQGQRLLAAASGALGREITAEDVGIDIGLGVGVALKKVRVAADPAVSSTQPLVTADRVEMRVRVWPLLRREVVRNAVADAEDAARDLLEPRDQAEHRRLAAPGWADRHEQLAVRDVERDVDERLGPAGVRLADVLEDDARHQSKKCSAARSGSTRVMMGSAAKWRWTAPSVRAFAAARKIIDWSRAR